MKIITLLLISIFTISVTFGQSMYINGFNSGYKKGYCHDQGIGCIEPIPPIAPIPKIGESSENFHDGYNRGFEMGLQARTSNSYSNPAVSTNRQRYQTSQPEFIDFTSSYGGSDLMNLKIRAITVISERAKQNLENGNYDSAIEDANSMLRVQPNLPLAYYIKSFGYYKKDKMIDAYNFSIKSDNSRGHKTEWGEFMNKEMNDYLETFMKAEDYNSVQQILSYCWYKNNLSNFYNGLSYYFQGNYKKSKKYLKNVKNFQLAKDYLASIKNEKYYPNPYIDQNDQTSYNSKQSNEELLEILKLLKSNQYEESIALIDITIKSQNNITLYGVRGTANYLLGNYREAISDITKSSKTNNGIKPDFLFYRALAKSEVGDFNGAISDYDLIIASGENIGQFYDMATIYNNKAYTYVVLKQYEKAVPFVNQALELDKNKWFIWDTRAEIYFFTSQYRKAINDASKAIKLQENDNSLYIRGMAYLKLKEDDLGCKDLSRAGELGKKEAYDEIKKSCN